jgi:hypothetical protein
MTEAYARAGADGNCFAASPTAEKSITPPRHARQNEPHRQKTLSYTVPLMF